MILCAVSAASAVAQPAPLLDILKQEMDRNFSLLKEKSDPAPYFLSYSVSEQQSEYFAGTLGTLQSESKNSGRIFDVSVRVGNNKLDNYHATRGERPQFSVPTLLPVDDIPDAIRRRVWLETDRATRAATQRLINLRTSTQVNVAEEDKSDDFSKEEPSIFSEPTKKFTVDSVAWAEKVRRWSAEFSKFPKVLSSGVSVRFLEETKYLVNTEGTRLQHGRSFARIMITAHAKAEDGMDLAASDSFEAEDAAGLPKDADVSAAIQKVGTDLTKLLDAPVVDAFVGPAILSGRASGVFFHEIFGHRIEGHRQKDESDQQTFTKMVGSKVLPDFLSVLFDPTGKEIGKHGPERMVLVRRRGCESPSRAGGRWRHAEDIPDVAIAHQGFLSIERSWAEAGRIGAGVSPIESYRRIEQAGFGSATAADARRRDQTAGQALRVLLRACDRRLHNHRTSGFPVIQGDSAHRVSGVSGWPAR